ncbi:conserved hypothetical protein [Vibrio chagasii]|nr:conserved hypothetical protein [Vibrio chagasii]CAH6926438.1 conserved hypothetical protein [Vibrio chagasii]CAH7028211.1 conserved hypothetical protein [Vibrio chagasii]CAH7070013.1 conserved hypothetical protein [Vibrio chagasii]CAH7141332.1 conserved hypothetical protein [Vibrio chagasii]
MRDMVQEVIEFELKHDFSFLDLPNNVPENIWKDGNGDFQNMDDMGLDHLKACIRLVTNAINNLEQKGRRDEVKDVLLPQAKMKLVELKNSFSEKSKV